MAFLAQISRAMSEQQSADVRPAPPQWQSLHVPRSELTLDFTLPTGQSFRWRKSGENEFTGVVNDRLVRLRQVEADVQWQVLARGPDSSESRDAESLREYFNLHEPLADMSREWAAKDPRFELISPYFPGARIMRQNPTECLFQFVCSSNNHISRIHGMVERLCSKYGSPLKGVSLSHETGMSLDPVAFYAFPTLRQLSCATEEDLRADGFGYRAKFITGSVAALLQKPEGGDEWLLSLRKASYKEAVEALVSLPGIGPKVAACICLFALDKHEAIPVDTHVWQLATKFYTPGLKGKTLTPKVMLLVENAFIDKFGPYAGWAHNVLFVSDLASSKKYLPSNLRPDSAVDKGRKRSSKVKLEEEEEVLEEVLGNAQLEGNQKTTKTMPTVLKVEWEKKATGTNEDALADAVQNLQQEGEDKIKLELKVRSRTSRQKAVEEDKQGVRTSGRLKVKSESKRQKEGAT